MVYDEICDDILKIERKRLHSFLKMGKFPLGTKNPPESYGSSIPDEDIVWMRFPEVHSPLSILILATSGYYKTVLMKRIMYYFHKDGWKGLVFEPKTAEWARALRKPFSKERLHPFEKPDILPIKPYLPSFIVENIPEDIKNQYEITTTRISDFDKRIYFYTLKFAPVGVEWLISNIKKYNSPKKLLKAVQGLRMGSAKGSLVLRLGALEDDNFFDPNCKAFDVNTLIKDWRKEQIPTLSFFSQDSKYISLYTGHILRLIFKLSLQHPEFRKKIIAVDDCQLLVGKEMDEDEYLSVRELIHSITLWRSLGFMMVFSTQSPRLLKTGILDDCKYLLVGRIGNPGFLSDYIGNPEIIQVIKRLRFQPARHLAEYCLINPDRLTYSTFYPFNPPVGHF